MSKYLIDSDVDAWVEEMIQTLPKHSLGQTYYCPRCKKAYKIKRVHDKFCSRYCELAFFFGEKEFGNPLI